MTIMPMGDFYVWYCERCDTRNLTLWARFDDGVTCGACQAKVHDVAEHAGRSNAA